MKRLCAVLVGLALAFPAVGFYEYGSGEKVGFITKVEKLGWICRTWEAELIRGGLQDGSGAIGGRAFHFTIHKDDVLLEKVKSAMARQVEVKIKYRQDAITFCSTHNDGRYFITDIEDLRSAKKEKDKQDK